MEAAQKTSKQSTQSSFEYMTHSHPRKLRHMHTHLDYTEPQTKIAHPACIWRERVLPSQLHLPCSGARITTCRLVHHRGVCRRHRHPARTDRDNTACQAEDRSYRGRHSHRRVACRRHGRTRRSERHRRSPPRHEDGRRIGCHPVLCQCESHKQAFGSTHAMVVKVVLALLIFSLLSLLHLLL